MFRQKDAYTKINDPIAKKIPAAPNKVTPPVDTSSKDEVKKITGSPHRFYGTTQPTGKPAPAPNSWVTKMFGRV